MRAKTYVCDDCGRLDEFTSYIKARASGWAVAKDYEKCYCPNCAPEHRRGAASETRQKKRSAEQWLPEGFEQLKIEG